MRLDPEGIAVFVAFRVPVSIGNELKKELDSMVLREKGRWLDTPADDHLVARFASGLDALAAVQRIQRRFASGDPESRPRTAIEVGEVLSGQRLLNNNAYGRSQELSELAWPGQTLVGPAAREILRPVVPAGFGLLELGELRLGHSISAEKISQLLIKGLQTQFERIEDFDAVLSNVPEPVDFIGRDEEARQVRRALSDSVLVSLTGPAGVGKSSLANWIASDLADSYRDGSWLVDLGKIPRAGNVATAISADLKLPKMPQHSAEDRVLTGLSTMQGLVWLDNCEHVLPELGDLLPKIAAHCKGVKFLATTQRKIGIEGEKVLVVHPFSLPTDPDDYANSEAVRLFLNRARKVCPDFASTHENLEAVAQICKQVEGLPLAIELASAQTSRMPVATISRRLKHALTTSTVQARHSTLASALAWSYSLLSAREQRFFRHLGVLAGPASRDLTLAAGAIGGGSEQELDADLQALLDASLLVDDAHKSSHRYRLLDPIRQFALTQLERNGEERRARTHFLKSCCGWVQRLAEAQMSAKRLTLLLEREYANLESALEWGLQAEGLGQECLVLAHQLYNFWLWNGPFDKAASYLEHALIKGKKLEGVDSGILYSELGLLEGYAGRYAKSEAAFVKALNLFKKVGNKRRVAATYSNFAIHVRNSGDLERAIEYGRKSLEFSSEDDPNWMKLLGNYATDLAEAGAHAEAWTHLKQAMRLNETIGDPEFMATHLATAAVLTLKENDTARGEDLLNDSLYWYRMSGDIQGLLSMLEISAIVALRYGRYERAAKLLGGTAAHFHKAGVGRNIPDAKRRDEALTTIESSLGNETAEAYYALGALLTLDELYDFARSGPDLESDPELF